MGPQFAVCLTFVTFSRALMHGSGPYHHEQSEAGSCRDVEGVKRRTGTRAGAGGDCGVRVREAIQVAGRVGESPWIQAARE
jgi:hypothetical protein